MAHQQTPHLDRLFDPEARLLHKTQRFGFEKRILEVDGFRQVLYRYYLPWQARQLAQLLRVAEARQLHLQRVQHCTGSWQEAWLHRGYWVVTSYLEGQLWPEVATQPGHAVTLAKALAGLHSIEAEYAGLATNWRQRNRHWLTTGIFSSCSKAVRFAHHIEISDKAEISCWLNQVAQILDKLPGFQLLHGDLTGKNVLVTGTDEVALIDYELCNYGFAGLELARALLGLVGFERKVHRPAFLATYLDHCPTKVKAAWTEFGAQLLIFQLLMLAYGRTVRYRILKKRGHEQDAAICHQQFVRNSTDALLLIRSFNHGERDPQLLLATIGR